MIRSMPGHKIHFVAVQGGLEAVGLTKGGFHGYRFQGTKTGGIFNAGASDNSDFTQSSHLFWFNSSIIERRSETCPMT